MGAQVLPQRLGIVFPDRIVDPSLWQNNITGSPDRGAERQTERNERTRSRVGKNAIRGAPADGVRPVSEDVQERSASRGERLPRKSLDSPFTDQGRRPRVVPARQVDRKLQDDNLLL